MFLERADLFLRKIHSDTADHEIDNKIEKKKSEIGQGDGSGLCLSLSADEVHAWNRTQYLLEYVHAYLMLSH